MFAVYQLSYGWKSYAIKVLANGPCLSMGVPQVLSHRPGTCICSVRERDSYSVRESNRKAKSTKLFQNLVCLDNLVVFNEKTTDVGEYWVQTRDKLLIRP